MLSEEVQLGFALEAYAWAHNLGQGWATKYLTYFRSAGVTSMSNLGVGCKENTINLDLELFGIPAQDRLSDRMIQYLRSFLPGQVGLRCFRLAQRCAEKVMRGSAATEYVHRPESGKIGKELWPKDLAVDDDWTLHVDCAGFVRNCLKHVTKDPFVMSLSDRDFMRAKDFFGFFESVPYTVMDKEVIPELDKRMRWRIVPDLRMVIPGDVIVYRPKGNAAGGAAFTTNDRKDLKHLLEAVKTSQLWNRQEYDWENLGTRNFAKDPKVKVWREAIKSELEDIGIYTIRELRANLTTVNDALKEKGYTPLAKDTLRLMKECAETTALNTGHIVFAAGPAVHKGDNEYRIRVVHSTKFGKTDENGVVTTGIQEYFRRFTMVEGDDGKITWTRQMAKCMPPGEDTNGNVTDDDDLPNDDMDDDNDLADEAVSEPDDELSGQAEVEVLAARMCF